MIDFKLTEEQQDLVANAHEFAKNVIRPAEMELDKIADPAEVFESDIFWNVMRETYRQGYHKISLPTHVGGLGLDNVTCSLINEELYWGGPGLMQNVMVAGSVAFFALLTGKTALINEFTIPFCNDTEAKHIGCFAGVEAIVGGSDLVYVEDNKTRLHTTALKSGDDYILNGAKAAFISAGGIANAISVAACIEPERGMRGTGLFIIPTDLPGISRGKPLDKLGLRCLNQTEIFFDEVTVPKKYLAIRPKGDNWLNFVRSFIGHGNTNVGLTALALMRSAYEDATEYAKGRIQGGKPIIEHPNIALKLFNAYQTIEAARSLFLRVSWTNANQFPADIPLTAAARCFACNQAMTVTAEMIQVLGAYGISKEYPVEKYFRDTKLTQIEDGAVDTMALAGMQLLHEPDAGREEKCA